MEIDINKSQGLTFAICPESGKIYPVPAGGSGNEAPPASDGEGGTVQSGDEGVQSGSEEGSGQGFLEPYLRDVPEDQRAVVEPILERYRQEQDANFNRRFEQLQEESKIPTTIYQALLDDPVSTMNWIAERMVEERGLDVRSELTKQWNPADAGPVENQLTQQQNEGKALTQEDLDRILEEREQTREQQMRQQQFEQQQAQQQAQTVNTWIDGAAKKFSLPLDDANGEDPLRAVVIMQANQLHESGVAKGQAAIEMAVEAVSKRFGSLNQSNKGNGKQPTTATGGSPATSNKDIDVSDAKQRKERMFELFFTSSE